MLFLFWISKYCHLVMMRNVVSHILILKIFLILEKQNSERSLHFVLLLKHTLLGLSPHSFQWYGDRKLGILSGGKNQQKTGKNKRGKQKKILVKTILPENLAFDMG